MFDSLPATNSISNEEFELQAQKIRQQLLLAQRAARTLNRINEWMDARHIATPEQWQRSFEEINQFEQKIVDHGTTILKFWLHISPEEQLHRFKARQQQPHKQYKITDDDWRNRDK
jgi:hypothetical protein